MIAVAEPFNWNALVSLLALIVSGWIAWQQQQRAKTAKEEGETLKKVAATVSEVKETVVKVQEHTNGMHTEIAALTAKASKSEGKEEERAEERQRVDEKAAAEKTPTAAATPTEVLVVNPPNDPANTTTIKKP